MLFHCSQEAQSVNSPQKLWDTIFEERSGGKLPPELHFSALETYLKEKVLLTFKTLKSSEGLYRISETAKLKIKKQ